MRGICTACHEPCEVVAIDFGYGQYEFWGKLGVHHDLAAVSNCCEAPATDESGHIINLRDLEDDSFEPPTDEEENY